LVVLTCLYTIAVKKTGYELHLPLPINSNWQKIFFFSFFVAAIIMVNKDYQMLTWVKSWYKCGSGILDSYIGLASDSRPEGSNTPSFRKSGEWFASVKKDQWFDTVGSAWLVNQKKKTSAIPETHLLLIVGEKLSSEISRARKPSSGLTCETAVKMDEDIGLRNGLIGWDWDNR